MKYLELANSWRWKVVEWLLGARRRRRRGKWGSDCLMLTKFPVMKFWC